MRRFPTFPCKDGRLWRELNSTGLRAVADSPRRLLLGLRRSSIVGVHKKMEFVRCEHLRNGVESLAEMAAGSCWQREVEGRSLAERARCPDMAAMLLHDAAADGESEPGAAHGAGIGCVDLFETIEDLLQLVRGDAAALVLDFNERLIR